MFQMFRSEILRIFMTMMESFWTLRRRSFSQKVNVVNILELVFRQNEHRGTLHRTGFKHKEKY